MKAQDELGFQSCDVRFAAPSTLFVLINTVCFHRKEIATSCGPSQEKHAICYFFIYLFELLYPLHRARAEEVWEVFDRVLGWPLKLLPSQVLWCVRSTNSSWFAVSVWIATTIPRSFPAFTPSVKGTSFLIFHYIAQFGYFTAKCFFVSKDEC